MILSGERIDYAVSDCCKKLRNSVREKRFIGTLVRKLMKEQADEIIRMVNDEIAYEFSEADIRTIKCVAEKLEKRMK